MLNTYEEFLERKIIVDRPTGLAEVPPLSPKLFDFQRDIVNWALKRGRAAIFADCGMGKTPMQLEWAKHIPGRVLILAPLAVATQTIREAEKFGIGDIAYSRNGESASTRIVVANYEMLHHFDCDEFTGVVLDESSILKSYDGKTRNLIIDSFAQTPFRLACTATPAPNDFMELGNHAQFLNTMSYVEMLATFFVHDGGETQKWRLKGHAESDFWKWLCSWAVMIRKPSDLGYEDKGFKLPEMTMHQVEVDAKETTAGMLFAMDAQTLPERIAARRESIDERVAACAKIVNNSDEPFIIWCNLNEESGRLAKAIPNSVEVKGSNTPEHKEQSLIGFADGEIRVLITKPSIAGFGMNFQRCHNMAFVGLSDSYEQFYQAVRRCWRFGQTETVEVYVITAETEGAVVSNIKRKERDAMEMAENMVEHMKDLNTEAVHGASVRFKVDYERDVKSGDGWDMHLGDCVEVLADLKTDTLDYSMYSPPFASLYTYSASDRDLGNCADNDEFFEHYKFVIAEIFRATKPGRLTSFHCMNMPTSKTRDGVIGLRDFRGELIRAHEAEGWIYHSEVCIWKNPVTAMQRTKALGLLHKQIRKDSCMSRMGIPDYVVTMRKPGDNPDRVTHTPEDFPVSDWQEIASPIWMDINPSDTLQYRSAREHNDERHICPLQLEVIRRCFRLWTNKGDLVLSPFAGIGSEGYVAIQMGRRFVGAELKRSYWEQAHKNLAAARTDQGEMFA